MILTFVKTLDDAAFCLPMLWFSDFQLKISKTPKLDLVNDQKIQTWIQEKRFDIKNTKHMRPHEGDLWNAKYVKEYKLQFQRVKYRFTR